MSDQTDRILRIKTVLDRTGLTRSTLYRKIDAGTFPGQIKLSTRCVGWRESSVAKWLSGPFGYDAANDDMDRAADIRHGKG